MMQPALNGAGKRGRKRKVAPPPPPPPEPLWAKDREFTMPLERFTQQYLQPQFALLAQLISDERGRWGMQVVDVVSKEIRNHQAAVTELLQSIIEAGTKNAKKKRKKTKGARP